MSAPADKLQLTLQYLLQQSLPLVHKGIFSKSQLKQIMLTREKLQGSMQKTTFKLTDYLKAIQYQYSLQRKRRFVIESADISKNPHFRKQNSADFAIVKRIIRLWDRTMHKYRYRPDLWKQYLSFALSINSKKLFYKALSNALKFLPFCEDLWKIAVQYEIEIGANLWKARKLYMKAVRVNRNRIGMWIEFVRFQLEFVRRIAKRESIVKGQDIGMKFVGGPQEIDIDIESEIDVNKEEFGEQNNYQQVNLQKHDEIIWLIIQECLLKCSNGQSKQKIIQKFDKVLQQQLLGQQNQTLVKKVIQKVTGQLQQLKKTLELPLSSFSNELLPGQQGQPDNLLNISIQDLKTQKPPTNKLQMLQYYKAWASAFSQLRKIDWYIMDKALRSLCLHAKYFSDLVVLLLDIQFEQTLQVLQDRFSNYSFSNELIIRILEGLSQRVQQRNISPWNKLIQSKIKAIAHHNFTHNVKLLKTIIKFNKLTGQLKANTILHRTLSIACKDHPQTIELCASLIRNVSQV